MQQFLCTSNSYLKGPEAEKIKKKQRSTQQQALCSSHLNKGTENVREQYIVPEKSSFKMIPTPWPAPKPYYKSTNPTYPIPPIICNNNTMDMTFLVQIRQSNKSGSVGNDQISMWT